MSWVNYALVFIVSVLSPLAFMFFLVFRQRKLLKPFFLGVLAFVVSQLLIRIPILQLVLGPQVWFIAFSYAYPWLFIFLISLSAGVFEEYGRYIAMKFFLKGLTLKQVLTFGLGHGGIEALLLVGVPVILNANLFMNTNALYAAIERISAMAFHCALSVIVYHALKTKKHRYVWMAILLHTAFNFFALGLLRLCATIWVLELFLFVFAFALLYFVIKEDRKSAQTMDTD